MADNLLFEKYGQTIENGKVIFREGDLGDRMYIIQSGIVRITKNIDGREYTLAELTKGEFLGEMAIVSRIRRTATATAVGSVQLLAFDRAGFQGMIEKNAKIAMNVIDRLCKRLQHTNSQLQDLVRKNVRSHIALILYYKFMEKDDEDPCLTRDRAVEDIAKHLGVPAATVGGAINELVQAGMLQLQGNALRMKNRDAISALAEQLGG